MLKTSQIQNDNMKKMANQIDHLKTTLTNQTELTKQKEAQISKMVMDINSLMAAVYKSKTNQQIIQKLLLDNLTIIDNFSVYKGLNQFIRTLH